jgi:hypothetical protein
VVAELLDVGVDVVEVVVDGVELEVEVLVEVEVVDDGVEVVELDVVELWQSWADS